MSDRELSSAELEQRRQAARTHGTYALRDRKTGAMTVTERGRYAELVEGLETPDGIAVEQRRRAALAVVMVEHVESYVQAQVEAGKSLDSIDLLKRWPAFQNAARHALKAAGEALPEEEKPGYQRELEHIDQVLSKDENAT